MLYIVLYRFRQLFLLSARCFLIYFWFLLGSLPLAFFRTLTAAFISFIFELTDCFKIRVGVVIRLIQITAQLLVHFFERARNGLRRALVYNGDIPTHQ